MDDAFTFAAAFLLLTVAVALVRCWKGPGRADRIMAAQLVGSGAIGMAIALGTARQDLAMLDAALTATLLAAVLVFAFVSAGPPTGASPAPRDRTQETEDSA